MYYISTAKSTHVNFDCISPTSFTKRINTFLATSFPSLNSKFSFEDKNNFFYNFWSHPLKGLGFQVSQFSGHFLFPLKVVVVMLHVYYSRHRISGISRCILLNHTKELYLKRSLNYNFDCYCTLFKHTF